MKADGSHRRKLGPGQDSVFSADGKKLAYTGSGKATTDVEHLDHARQRLAPAPRDQRLLSRLGLGVRRSQADRQRLQLVQEQRAGVGRLAGELDVGEAAQGLLEQHLDLQPRERGAEAEVAAAGAERLVVGARG